MDNVAKQLLRHFGLTPADVEQVLAVAFKDCERKDAFGEIFFQRGAQQFLELENGETKENQFEKIKGAGIRVVIGEKRGYSYTSTPTLDNLIRAAEVANLMARYGADVEGVETEEPQLPVSESLYPIRRSPVSVHLSRKLALLEKLEAYARSKDARITRVTTSIAANDYHVIIAPWKRPMIYDRRPLLRLNCACIAEDAGRIETGSSGGGGRYEFSRLLAKRMWQRRADQAVQMALAALEETPAPSGEMTVVLGSGWPGVLVHEAIGHGLEGDFNRKNLSAFSGRVGQRVAADCVTIVDQGDIPQRRGSITVDDEGTPSGECVLIEHGILKGYLQDRQNARLMGVKPTGNGRRQDYRCAPMPRMTNTHIRAGTASLEEMIESVDDGIYAESFQGGEVNITNGKFVFVAQGAWKIEKGKLVRRLKGVTFIGDGPTALKHITMVGKDWRLDEGVGTCGKNGQGVPVGVGMPPVVIEHMTVGGTEAKG